MSQVLSFTRHRDTAVPAEGNGNWQTLICVLMARPRRCSTLSNHVPWQNWMVAYLDYTLRMKTRFCGWPVMVRDTHTRRRRLSDSSKCCLIGQSLLKRSVHCPTVSLQVYTLWAFINFKSQSTTAVYSSNVAIQVTRSCQSFVTQWTFVSLFSRVDFHVVVQMCRLTKCLVTHMTFIWLLSRVDSYVTT